MPVTVGWVLAFFAADSAEHASHVLEEAELKHVLLDFTDGFGLRIFKPQAGLEPILK